MPKQWTKMEDFWDKEDLDRCEHGRHSIDRCNLCLGGISSGNRFLEDGARIGTNRMGEPILARPRRESRNDA